MTDDHEPADTYLDDEEAVRPLTHLTADATRERVPHVTDAPAERGVLRLGAGGAVATLVYLSASAYMSHPQWVTPMFTLASVSSIVGGLLAAWFFAWVAAKLSRGKAGAIVFSACLALLLVGQAVREPVRTDVVLAAKNPGGAEWDSVMAELHQRYREEVVPLAREIERREGKPIHVGQSSPQASITIFEDTSAEPPSAGDPEVWAQHARGVAERTDGLGRGVASVLHAERRAMAQPAESYAATLAAWTRAGGLDPATLGSHARVANRYDLLRRFRSANRAWQRHLDGRLDRLRQAVAAGGGSPRAIEALTEAYGGEDVDRDATMLRRIDEELCKCGLAILKLLSSEMGRWRVDHASGEVRFTSPEAGERYTRYADFLERSAAKQRELLRRVTELNTHPDRISHAAP